MRYTLEVTIALPRNRVVELFDDSDNLYKWQEGLVNLEPLSGIQRLEGAKTKLIHKFRNNKVEMIETVEKRNFPDEFICTYEAKNTWNRTINRFIEIDYDKTMWVLIAEFRCVGFLKILAFIMPGLFRKSTLKDMREFKRFAENQPKGTLHKLNVAKINIYQCATLPDNPSTSPL